VTPKIIGAVMLGFPLVTAAWVMLWNRNRAVFWFAFALIQVSLGYLMATGATDDIANLVLPHMPGSAPAKAN
jgi:dipeptide/tripeptide permease